MARGCGDDCEREQNSQPDALIFDILDKNEDIGSERNCFLRKRLGMTAMWCFYRKVLPLKNEFLRCRIEERLTIKSQVWNVRSGKNFRRIKKGICCLPPPCADVLLSILHGLLGLRRSGNKSL